MNSTYEQTAVNTLQGADGRWYPADSVDGYLAKPKPTPENLSDLVYKANPFLSMIKGVK